MRQSICAKVNDIHERHTTYRDLPITKYFIYLDTESGPDVVEFITVPHNLDASKNLVAEFNAGHSLYLDGELIRAEGLLGCLAAFQPMLGFKSYRFAGQLVIKHGEHEFGRYDNIRFNYTHHRIDRFSGGGYIDFFEQFIINKGE